MLLYEINRGRGRLIVSDRALVLGVADDAGTRHSRIIRDPVHLAAIRDRIRDFLERGVNADAWLQSPGKAVPQVVLGFDRPKRGGAQFTFGLNGSEDTIPLDAVDLAQLHRTLGDTLHRIRSREAAGRP